MKKLTLLGAILISCASYAQEFTSFEEPNLFSGLYTDTGDSTVAHALLNNVDEPLINYTSIGGELGFNSFYVPYDTPGDGLTDGDEVGVTDSAPSGTDPFTDGIQGYQISDVDGNFILEIDPVLSSSSLTFSIDYFVAETGYEGDGTVNGSGSDRLRIYLKDLAFLTEYDILNTTGNNINDVLVGGDPIEGRWINGSITVEDLIPGTLFQLIIEARCNSSSEIFYFDNINIIGVLGVEDNKINHFTLFPNPSNKGFITIISELEDDLTITVFSVLGKQVIHTTISDNELDITDLKSGVYIVKITQGFLSITKKLIVR